MLKCIVAALELFDVVPEAYGVGCFLINDDKGYGHNRQSSGCDTIH